MLIIRYTPPIDLDLEGTSADLKAIVRAISKMTPDSPPVVLRADPRHDGSSYDRCLSTLEICVADRPARVSVTGEAMVVEGSLESLRRFASFCTIGAGNHAHYEYCSGNDLIAQDSIPLVISTRQDD